MTRNVKGGSVKRRERLVVTRIKSRDGGRPKKNKLRWLGRTLHIQLQLSEDDLRCNKLYSSLHTTIEVEIKLKTNLRCILYFKNGEGYKLDRCNKLYSSLHTRAEVYIKFTTKLQGCIFWLSVFFSLENYPKCCGRCKELYS